MEEGARQAVALLRAQRHSFVNHLQVISGWLQLKNPERALGYIDRLTARLAAEGQILRELEDPAVALFVLDLGLQAESHGVLLEWRPTGPVDAGDLAEAGRRIAAGLEEAASRPEGERRLLVVLNRPIAVHRPATRGEG